MTGGARDPQSSLLKFRLRLGEREIRPSAGQRIPTQAVVPKSDVIQITILLIMEYGSPPARLLVDIAQGLADQANVDLTSVRIGPVDRGPPDECKVTA